MNVKVTNLCSSGMEVTWAGLDQSSTLFKDFSNMVKLPQFSKVDFSMLKAGGTFRLYCALAVAMGIIIIMNTYISNLLENR